MRIIAINGSPRKNMNTAKALQSAIDGAKSVCPEAQAELIHLYDYDYSGCRSCFACKRRDERFMGKKCFYHDGISDVLDDVSHCDGLIIGTPIYFGEYSAQLHAFLERLLYAYSTYRNGHETSAPKRMPTALIHTMNVPEQIANKIYPDGFGPWQRLIGDVFTPPRVLNIYFTYQFDDYSKYLGPDFSEEDKRKQRDNQFPIDLKRAFELGAEIATSGI